MSEPNTDARTPALCIGQIGLGAIGTILAGHLSGKAAAFAAYDIDVERARAAARAGIRVVGTMIEALRDADFIVVSLPSPEAVRTVLLGPEGAFTRVRPRKLFIDLSTIDPLTAREAYAAATAAGHDYLEAPISGGEPMSAGTDGVRNRNVTFMAAGDQAAFERARVVMQLLGRHMFFLGPAGMGATVKLISNHISGIVNLVVAEAFALGRACHVEPALLLDVFRHTDANTYWLFNYFAPRITDARFEPGFSVDLQYKDLRLVEDLARSLRVAMPMNALAMQIYQFLRARGQGGKDLVEAANLFAEWAGVPRYDRQSAATEASPGGVK